MLNATRLTTPPDSQRTQNTEHRQRHGEKGGREAVVPDKRAQSTEAMGNPLYCSVSTSPSQLCTNCSSRSAALTTGWGSAFVVESSPSPLRFSQSMHLHSVSTRAQAQHRISTVCALGDQPLESSRRHAIVTGANTGIGRATALELAKKGMAVTLACRNEEDGRTVAREISQATSNSSVRSMALDLASLQSVQQFVTRYEETGLPLHVLVNNAGIMACPQDYTEDNFERQLGVNHLGHFLLTALLVGKLIASASAGQKSRVVVLASAAERIGEIDFADLNYKGSRAYNNWTAYGQSKLANCLFSYELAKRSKELELPIISNSMHPGIVNTMLIRYVFPAVKSMGDSPSPVACLMQGFLRLFGLKSPEEGASTAVFLASSPEIEMSSGLYYEDCKESMPSLNAVNPRLASQLWDSSVELTGASAVLEPLGLTSKRGTFAST